jgi:hypothetical protein
MSEVNIPSIASTAGSSGLGMAMAHPTREMEDLDSPYLASIPSMTSATTAPSLSSLSCVLLLLHNKLVESF